MRKLEKNTKICLAAALLAASISGCANEPERESSVIVSTPAPVSSSSSAQSASVSSSSSEASSPQSAESAESSSRTSSEESSSSSSESEPEQSSPADVPVVYEGVPEGAIMMNYNPEAYVWLKIEDNKVTLGGKTGFLGVTKHAHSNNRLGKDRFESDGENFIAETDFFDMYDGLSMIYLYNNKGVSSYYRLMFTNGKITLPLKEDYLDRNIDIQNDTIDAGREQTAEQIVIGGDPEKVNETLEKLKTLSDEICEGIEDDYEKLRAISYWVMMNIYYDHAASAASIPPEETTLYFILETKRTVCGGYANITAALSLAQGIKTCVVHGAAPSSGSSFFESSRESYHEWNYAVINGRNIWIDNTWNSNCDYNASGKYVQSSPQGKYFDMSAELMSQNHVENYAEYRDFFALYDQPIASEMPSALVT